MSIRLRLALWQAGLLGIVLAGFAVLVYLAVARQLTTQLDYAIHLQALEASRSIHTVSLGAGVGQPPRLDFPFTARLADGKLYVQLLDTQGGVLVSSSNLSRPLLTPLTSLRSSLEGQDSHATLRMSGESLDLYSVPLLVDDRIVGVLQVAASLQPMEESLASLRLILLGIVLGVLALAGGLGWLLAAKAMQPVDIVTQTAQAIAHSADLSRRLAEPRQRDEIGRLAATFNQMLGRLDQLVTMQRRFLADASHELRTPLTTIRMNLQALRRGADTDPSEREATIDATVRETERMARLVADLLALARADAGQTLDRRPLMLDTLLLDVYRQECGLANGVQLQLGEFEQIEVAGDSDRLRQLILNLVDNGLRYTPSGGSVMLALSRSGVSAALCVHDTGPGIAIEHLPHIFERFYRVDQPRSRQAGGTGLGLAICQWIAEAHGGCIEVESQLGVGSTFTVYLPLGEATALGANREPEVQSVPAPSWRKDLSVPGLT